MKDKLVKLQNDPKMEKELKEKIEKVYNVLDNSKNKELDTETLEMILNTQQLLEDIENDD